MCELFTTGKAESLQLYTSSMFIAKIEGWAAHERQDAG